MSDTARGIGTLITRERRRRGLTLAEVARQSGYAKSYVADIEKGRKNPTIDAVEAVGKVVGLAPAVLWASVASITGIIPMTAEERLDHIMHVADMGLRS